MDHKLYHLIFIDDDKDFLKSMKMAMSSKHFDLEEGVEIESHFINNPKESLSFIQELYDEQENIAVIVSDQQMPDMTGIELMEKSIETVPKAMKILLTGYASLESAKYAINNQVLDQYVSKPIEDYDNFVSLINNAIKSYHYREEREPQSESESHLQDELEEFQVLF